MTRFAQFQKTLLLVLFSLLLAAPAFTEDKAKPEKAEKKPVKQEKKKPEKAAKDKKTADAVVATVNGEEITQERLNEEIEKVKGSWEARGMPEEQIEQMVTLYQPKILESLVATVLIEQECKKQKITVSDEEVTAELKEVEKSLPPDMTMKDIKEKHGLTDETLRHQAREQVKLKKLLKVKQPTEEEIDEFYNDNFKEVRARHILIKVDEDDTKEQKAEKKKQAEDIRKKIVEEDADFAEMASEYSACPSKEEGGDLGFFTKRKMVPAFSDVAFNLETNEVSEVVETRFGYHIIETLETKVSGPPLDEIKNNLRQALMERQIQEAAMEQIEKLKEDAEIVYTEKPKDLKELLPKPLPPKKK